MKIRKWYWIALFIWAMTGLPLYIGSQGMFGQSIFDVFGFISGLAVPTSSWDAFITWFIPILIIFFPLLLLPWAFSRRPKADKKRRDSSV
jgi:uncharacterized membrane protein YhaH (DUF805 family)